MSLPVYRQEVLRTALAPGWCTEWPQASAIEAIGVWNSPPRASDCGFGHGAPEPGGRRSNPEARPSNDGRVGESDNGVLSGVDAREHGFRKRLSGQR